MCALCDLCFTLGFLNGRCNNCNDDKAHTRSHKNHHDLFSSTSKNPSTFSTRKMIMVKLMNFLEHKLYGSPILRREKKSKKKYLRSETI